MADGNFGNITATGNITAAGNILGNNVSATQTLTAHYLSLTGNILGDTSITGTLDSSDFTASNIATPGTITAAGSIATTDTVYTYDFSASGFSTLAYVSILGDTSTIGNIATANLSANNITGNSVSVSGNVAAAYYTGNGSLLSGVNYYTNSNVASYLPVYTGNITANNIVANSVTANYIVGNTGTGNTGQVLINDGNTITWGNVLLPNNTNLFSVARSQDIPYAIADAGFVDVMGAQYSVTNTNANTVVLNADTLYGGGAFPDVILANSIYLANGASMTVSTVSPGTAYSVTAVSSVTGYKVLPDFLSSTVIANTVIDSASTLVINQSSSLVNLTINPPTNPMPGRTLAVVNSGTVPFTVTVGTLVEAVSVIVAVGASVTFTWDGNIWRAPLNTADVVCGNVSATGNIAGNNISCLSDISAGNIAGNIIITTTPPLTATDAGIPGQIAVDAGYIYVCTGAFTWVRAALTSW